MVRIITCKIQEPPLLWEPLRTSRTSPALVVGRFGFESWLFQVFIDLRQLSSPHRNYLLASGDIYGAENDMHSRT